MADIERWITINGAHIPIIKGESRARAVANFIKSKKAKTTERRKEARQNEYFDYVLKNYEKNKKGFKQVDKSLKGDELDYRAREYTNNEAGDYMRKKYGENWKDGKRTIKGRALSKEGVEDERFDIYDEHAHNVAKNLRFDNRKNPLSQDELYDRAHEIAKGTSMYEIDYKYGKGGTHENKQVKIGDNIESARYKLKTDKETPAKRTIKGVGKTESMKKAEAKYDKAYDNLRRIEKGRRDEYSYLTAREYGELKERAANKLDNAFANYERATTFKMTDANRRKMINDIGSKVTKLDRQVENAKTTPEFRRLQKKEAKAQKVINALGGKYIVGRKKKK